MTRHPGEYISALLRRRVREQPRYDTGELSRPRLGESCVLVMAARDAPQPDFTSKRGRAESPADPRPGGKS
jgi:hypothetical protein